MPAAVTGSPSAAAAPQAPDAGRATSLSPRQITAIALVGLLAVAAFGYAWYVVKGGLYSDDWSLISEIQQPTHGSSWWSAVEWRWSQGSSRPVSVAYYPIVFWILGTHATLQLLWSLAVSVAFVGFLFGVLRRLGMAPVHAFAIAALVLLAPTGDSVVLWASAAPIRLAGTLYLAGLFVAIGALRMPDTRRSWRRHIVALVLYVCSIWTYELAVALVGAGLLAYLVVAPPRQAVTRWLADMAVALPAMYWVLSRTPKKVQDHSQLIHHAKMITHQLWDMYGAIVVPSWLPAGLGRPVTILAGVVGIALLVALWRGVAKGPAAAEARRWTITGAIAFVYAMAAYVVFVPADYYYSPAAVNFGNRVNGVGVVPLVLLGYAAVMVLATVVLYRRPQWLRGAMALGLVYAVAMLFTHHSALRDHEDQYVQASTLARAALADVQRTVPHPADGTLIITTNLSGAVAPDLPVFSSTWDFQGAVRTRYDNATLDGFNAISGFLCTNSAVTVPGGPSGRYGSTVIVDILRHKAWPITSHRACSAVAKILRSPA
jgi:hypothetical protein